MFLNESCDNVTWRIKSFSKIFWNNVKWPEGSTQKYLKFFSECKVGAIIITNQLVSICKSSANCTLESCGNCKKKFKIGNTVKLSGTWSSAPATYYILERI